MYDFSVDCNAINKSDKLSIQKYLMVKNIYYKLLFWLVKKVFIVLLSFSESLATKSVSLNDKTCVAGFTLVNLNPIKLNYYLFIISLDKCNRSCNAVDH